MRGVAWSYDSEEGFGECWRLRIGWLQIDWTRFEDHWHFQAMWAKPYLAQFPAKPKH